MAREKTITEYPVIDTNLITSDRFDAKEYLSELDAHRLDTLKSNDATRHIADNVEAMQKMAAFTESITGNRVNDTIANDLMYKAMTGKPDTLGAWESVRNSWRNGRNQMDRAELRWEEMIGLRPINYDLPPVSQMPVHADNWFESSLNAATNMLPMMLETAESGIWYGLGTGTTAAGFAALAGQAGPQIATPEEIVTVPGAFATFGTAGAIYGGAWRATQIEAGLMFDELLSMRGPNGERIDPNIAVSIAAGVGLVNGLIEVAQIDEIIKTIPGGRSLLRKGIKRAIRKVVKDKSLLKIAGKHLTNYGKTITVETMQELAQESSNIVGGELAKYLNEAVGNGKITRANADEIMNRYANTATESVKAFSIIGGPGHVGGVVVDVVDQQQVRVKPRVSSDQEMTRVTDIRPRVDPLTLADRAVDEAITQPSAEQPPGTKPPAESPILNAEERKQLLDQGLSTFEIIKEEPTVLRARLGKLTDKKIEAEAERMVTLDLGLRPKLGAKVGLDFGVAEHVVEVTEDILADWDRDFEQRKLEVVKRMKQARTEGKRAAPRGERLAERVGVDQAKLEEMSDEEIANRVEQELPTKVKPKLYIGNVTRRMKRKFAEIFGKEEGDVKPFLDGPFPTKREAIEMTTDQAFATLVMLEASLEQRLNDNLVRTENDLAQANADWGDIKSLRKVLGLPEVTRPFTVKRAPKPKIIVPDTIGQRVEFSVQMSKADVVTKTRIQELNDIMKRMRKAAREGFAAARKEMRELQLLQRRERMRRQIAEKIRAKPSKGLDPFYKKAIEQIQDAMDFEATTEEKTAAKDGLRQHLDANPDKVNEIPQDVMDSLEKRDINTLSLAQLQQIHEEVRRLVKLGRLKSKLMQKQLKMKLDNMVDVAKQTVTDAKKPRQFSKERASFLRPLRILDMLDGRQKFDGPLVNMFDTAIQDAADAELRHVDFRHQKGNAKLKELGLSLFHFARRRKVGDVTLTVDDMLGIYAGWMNPQSRLALQEGGIVMTSGKTMKITEELHDQVIEALTEEERKWAEFVMEEYAENWERIRNAVILAENRDMGRVPNYTKMRRIGVDKAKPEDVLAGFDYADETDYRLGVVQVHDRFTRDRKPIPPEFQLPIDTSLTKVWEGEVRKQEHYIAMARLLKELDSVVLNKGFKEAVTDKFGAPVYNSLRGYLRRTADADYYRNFTDIEAISKAIRKNTAVAFLAYNLLTISKQVPSIMFYAVNSSFSDLLMSAIQVAVNPRKTLQAIESHNSQISHAAIVREMEELKHANRKAWNLIVRRVGVAGLRGIYEVDRAVRVVGENAIINHHMRKGLSFQEAVKKARQTSLRTQPAASSKDIAQLYANNEVLNWFTMFTNQLNQIYNIATYDIPAAWHNREFMEVGRSTIALSVVAMWIWMLQNKELPDEPEDIADAFVDQSLAAIPLIGSAALSGKRGFDPPTPSVISQAARMSGAAFSGDMDRIIPAALEATAIGTGTPFVGLKRIYETAEEEDLWELVGGKK